jgi:ATP-dependent helicase/nuclease subunit B
MSSATLNDLLDMLEQDTPLLLPTSRSAKNLRAAFDDRQRALNLAAWQPAPALSWQQWTSSLWSELIVTGAETRLLLNPTQEHTLWREIIAEDAATSALSSADSLADLASSAGQLAARYNATSRLRSSANTHDSRTFAAWADTFTKRCATHAYLSAAQLEQALHQHIESGNIPIPASLNLVGFNILTPAEQSLLETFAGRGTKIITQQLQTEEAPQLRAVLSTETEREELTTAARWLRTFLQQNHRPTVAVLVPNLAEERPALEEILRQTLAPELNAIDTDLSATPWEFSTGVPLSSLRLIADALDLARWADGPLPLARVSSLLLSPYLGSFADRDLSARYDAHTLRQATFLRSELNLSSFLALSPLPKPIHWPYDLRSFLQQSPDLTKPRTFAAWMQFLRDLLQAAHWPGDRPLNATEFELTRAWDSLLDLLATLDFSGRRVPYATALRTLERQAQTTLFTPPATQAAVQIMSPTEAEGCLFDAVLYLHATDDNLPAAERSHPFLAWSLQRDHEMPGTDPTHTTDRARAALNSLLERTPNLLFTHAKENADGKLRPSPLLAELPLEALTPSEVPDPAPQAAPILLDDILDTTPLPPLPSNEVPGGASLLKLQAACGFLAFAERRLLATEPDTSDLGLDPGESGTLLHRTMQNFWNEVQSQDKLRGLSTAEREKILQRSIAAAMPRKLRSEGQWDTAYLALIQQRLLALLMPWLERELERSPFTVLESEQKQPVTIGPLTMNIRFDRIDKVGDGFFLVDYKTGYASKSSQWDGPRPDDPQLPLYALLHEADELKGLAFAKLRAGKDMKWDGYQTESLLLGPKSKKVTDMAPILDAWRHTLTHLAEDFAAGNVEVFPKDYKVNCARCAQRLLCRLDPASLSFADADLDETEETDG